MMEKMSREFIEKEMKDAERQMHRFAAVYEFCKWILENKDFAGQTGDANGPG